MPSTSSSPLGRARVDAVRALVGARVVRVGKRERQLLARGAEAARRAVERRERGVLDQAVDAAGPRAGRAAAHGSAITTGSGASSGRATAWATGSASAAAAAASASARPRRVARGITATAPTSASPPVIRNAIRNASSIPATSVSSARSVSSAYTRALLGIVGEAPRLRVERRAQAVARVGRVEVGDQRAGQLDLVQRRELRVEHQRGAALAHVRDGVVELRGGDRGDQQRARA